MAKITILAGGFPQGEGEYNDGRLTLRTFLKREATISVSTFKTLEIATEEPVNNMKGAIGYGIAGAMLLGPIGAIAGFLLANKKTEVTFIATLKDGKQLLAAVDEKTYRDISKRVHVHA